MITLSARQFNLMHILKASRHVINEEELSQYDMRTLASMIKRGYLVRTHLGVTPSVRLKETLKTFEDTDVFRKKSAPLSIFVQQFVNSRILRRA